jgi:outer membrane protein TolC
MRKWIFQVIVFGFSSELAFSSVSLKQAFEAARVNMESIKRADAFVQQNEELKSRAEATIRPTISGVASYTKIDPPSAAGRSPFLLTRQYSYGFRLSQPIVRGGSIAALELAKENIILARYQRDASEINLYQLVINSYYNLALAKSDLNNVLELKNFSQERVKVISDRSSIGRSRRGELVEAQAQLHIAESQYQEALNKLQEAQRIFEFYTSLNPNEVNLETPLKRETLSLDAYIQKLKSIFKQSFTKSDPDHWLHKSLNSMYNYIDIPWADADISLTFEFLKTLDQRRGLNSQLVFPDLYNI